VTRIVLIAAKGSPGVTTLASAMVLARATSGAVLVEADRRGGDLALIHGVSQSPGLAELAARARRTAPGAHVLAPYIRALAGGMLPAVLAPVDAQAVCAALNVLADRADLLIGDDESGRAIVVDMGLVEPDGPGWSWLTACESVLLISRTDLTGLAHARVLAAQVRASGASGALALIDTGTYPCAEAEQVLGLPLAGVLPFLPRQAGALLDPDTVRAAASGRLAMLAGEVFDAVTRQRQEVPVS
jgi:MinD-like ATPase involved in chromosome partitioning or flagellar assembly